MLEGAGSLKQVGIVIYVHNDIAQVLIKRASACGDSCKTCSGGCETTTKQIEAYNSIKAKKGDTVLLELKDSYVLFAAFLIYIVPLIMLFVGYAIGMIIFTNGFAAGVMGVISLILAFIILKRLDRVFQRTKKFQPIITKVIS